MWRSAERASLEKKPSIRLSQALRVRFSKSFAKRRHRPSQAKVRSTNRCTLLPGRTRVLRRGGAARRVWWWNSEYDLDRGAVDLDAADEGTNNFALSGPIELGQSLRYFRGEVFQTTDDETKVAFTFSGSNGGFVALLKMRQPLLHTRNPWFKFVFLDEPVRIAVDEPADPAPQGGHLLVQPGRFLRRGGAVGGLGDAAPEFVGHALRCKSDSNHDPFQCFS